MATIEILLISELNELCKEYLAQKAEFKKFERIKELFSALRHQGFSIVTLQIDDPSTEFTILSKEGKQALKQRINIRKKKKAALDKQEFELAAYIRDAERKLERKILVDFSQNTESKHFVLARTLNDIIFFNDPDNLLTELFK